MDRVKRGILLSASVLIAVFLYVLAQPISNTSAYQNSTNLQINYAEMIRMNLSDSFRMRIAADGRPHFQASALKISLETNSYYGYDFMMETESPDLVNTADPTIKIPNMRTYNSLVNPDDTIPMNTWGLGVVKETGEFQDIFYSNGNNIPLKPYTFMGRNTQDVAHDRLALVIGAKLDDTIPSGSYTTSIKFTLVPRIIPNSILNTTYLQDVTDTVVGTMATNQPYQLTDLRDKKKYFIAKDSSNKVMMIQNLDYDLGDGDTLGQMTSQIGSGYKQISNVADHVAIDYNQAAYVSGNNVYRDENGVETVNNEEPETATEANNKAGGYYSYAAAIANTVNLYDASAMVSNSLCPKGWRLPDRVEAQMFNANSPANAWSNNNGYIDLTNNIKLDEGQYYWTAEYSQPKKLVDAFNPTDIYKDNYVDARILASVRCQYNNLTYFTYKVNVVYGDNAVKTYTYNNVAGSAPYTQVKVERDLAPQEGKRIIGFSTSPISSIPEYPINTYLDPNYTSCFENSTTDRCTDYVRIPIEKSETTVYAIWSAECNRDATIIAEAVCMQDMNPSVRDSMVENTQYRLKDQRDGRKYWITKLSDGKVWMTQNLNYYVETTKVHYPDESDVTATTQTTINASMEEGYYMKNGITKKTLSSQSEDLVERHYNLGKYYGSTEAICPGRWHVGDIAEAAKAAGIISDNSIVSSDPNYSGATYDASLTNSRLFGAPLYLAAGGYRENNKSFAQGEKAKYLKPGAGSVFTLETDNGKNTIIPNTSRDYNQYVQVRCVSDPKSMEDIEYMQDINNELIMFTENGTELQLKDKRDEKKYWVTKDDTGYVYMLQNLDLYIPDTGITFYSNTSDMDSTIANNRDTSSSIYIEGAHTIKADNNNPEIIYAYDAGDYYVDEDRNLVSTEGLAEDAPELKEHVGTYYTATAASLGRFAMNLFQTFTICPKHWTVESQKYIRPYYYYYTGVGGNIYNSPGDQYTHKSNPALARKYAPVDGNGNFILRDVDTSEGSGVWGNSNNHYFNGDVNNLANDRGYILHPVRCVIDLPFVQYSYH